MTPLEEAQARNVALSDELQWELYKQARMGGTVDVSALNAKCISQRLETLIDYVFNPQPEVSLEAFELTWEDTYTEILNVELDDARRVVELFPDAS